MSGRRRRPTPARARRLAAGGPAVGGTSAPALTAAELAPIAREAVAQWAAAGLTAAQLAELNSVQYQITTLGAGELGMTGLDSKVVTLDATAGGYGGFVDPTPADDSEFALAVGPYEVTTPSRERDGFSGQRSGSA